MTTNKHTVRRPVVSSQPTTTANTFRCVLACGHRVTVNGRSHTGLPHVAPYTTRCRECEQAARP